MLLDGTAAILRKELQRVGQADRLEAQYDGQSMTHPPLIAIDGDATLCELSDHRGVAQRHFVAHMQATQNRAEAIVGAFDRATLCYTADLADWVRTSTVGLTPSERSACAPAS